MSIFRFSWIAAAWLALPALAVDLPVIADASVGASTTPSGALPNLLIGGGNRALLRFEMGVLPAGLAPSQVVKATLIFHANRVNAAGPVRVSLLQGPFAEATVTQATAPPAGALLGAFSAVAGPNLIDVTGVVQQWVSSPASAFGLDLSVDAAAVTNLQVDSKENIATSYASTIRVVLAGPMGVAGARGPTGPTGPTGQVSAVTQQTQRAICDLFSASGLTPPSGYPCPPRLVFVTEGAWNAALGGLDGADAKCNSEAAAKGKSGTFKAWLSTATISASSRMFQSNVPYVRADGATVAMNWADLVDGNLLNPISLTAGGVGVNTLIWTNTSTSGGIIGQNDCRGWTSASRAELTPNLGATFATNFFWTQNTQAGCDGVYRLSCFEQ